MGARAGLLHAVNYPDSWDALILISGNPGIEDATARAERVKADEALAQSLERMGVAGFLDFWQETPLVRSQQTIPSAWRKTMLKNRQHHTVEGLAASLRQFGQGSCPNLWPQIGQLAMPVCLISGAKDTKYTEIATRMLERLPHAKSRHAIIEAASHMPHLEQAEATVQVVNDFGRAIVPNRRVSD
jgi:2-succinyl-6-hydroxy-2,4-cyclohexadiene-1-carboxylate synthase